jgi:CRISPR-associated protein Cmr1
MAQVEFKLRVVSPMFLNGADTRQPEMRAASVRGQLRYWLRAILGAQTDDLNWIWERESAVFGSTGRGSAVSVRIFGTSALELGRFPMLPHREGTQANVSMADAIKPNQSFDLQLVTRPGINIPSDVLYALQLWSLLGGLGKRSRRMMGAIDIRPKPPNVEWWYEKPQTPDADAFKDTLVKILSDAVHSPVKTPAIPPFPVLRPNHSWIIIGGSPANDPKQANQEFFRELLRNSKFKPQQDVFGYAKGSKRRRASPIIAQVRKIGDGYYPVITAFRSQPLERANYSDVLRDFMQTATQHYNGIHVWGGW